MDQERPESSEAPLAPQPDRQLPHPRWNEIAERLAHPALATANRKYRRAHTRKRRGHKLAGVR